MVQFLTNYNALQ